MLSEKGTIKETPVMKLLLTIFERELTGILYVKRLDVLKVLYFSRGKMIWAISNSEADKLENILVSRDLVDPVAIRNVKKQARVSDSIGKLLVGNGLITLEELIESSREQLRRIIMSVLKWKDGGFQFIKDAPPEHLLSLDLNITTFIIDYIVEELALGEIWKVIGSLQIELIKNPDQEKLARYPLTDKQKELLNYFNGEVRLEAVLSRYSGGHRESLLKIVYFFLMAELLIKKEFDLSDSSIFGDGQDAAGATAPEAVAPDEPFQLDFPELSDENELHAEDVDWVETVQAMDPVGPLQDEDDDDPATAAPPVSAEDIHRMNKQQADVFADYEKEDDEYNDPVDDHHRRHDNELDGDHDDDGEGEEPVAVETAAPPSGKKTLKVFNLVLILVFLAMVLGGIILLVLPWFEGDNNMSGIKGTINTNGNIENTGEENIGANSGGGTVETGGTTGTGETAVTPTPDITTDPGRRKPAVTYFREGMFTVAGDAWKEELIADGITHSILLELDCKKESVKFAYGKIESKAEFFILNRRSRGNSCYLVMWGKFRGAAEAEAGLKQVPEYFWGQQNPPRVTELAAYF